MAVSRMKPEQYLFQLDLEVTSVNDKSSNLIPSRPQAIKITEASLVLKGKPAHRDDVLPTTMAR